MLISQVELPFPLIMAYATNRARFSCDPKTVKGVNEIRFAIKMEHSNGKFRTNSIIGLFGR